MPAWSQFLSGCLLFSFFFLGGGHFSEYGFSSSFVAFLVWALGALLLPFAIHRLYMVFLDEGMTRYTNRWTPALPLGEVRHNPLALHL